MDFKVGCLIHPILSLSCRGKELADVFSLYFTGKIIGQGRGIDRFVIQQHDQVVLGRINRCPIFDRRLAERTGTGTAQGEPDTPRVATYGFLGRVLHACDGIAIQDVLRLVSHSLDPDLELALFSDNRLSLVHVNTCELDADIACNIVQAGERVYLCVLGSKSIYLVFKDPLHIIRGRL